jgi:hypothetical protein
MHEDVLVFAKDKKLEYIEASAKDNYNVIETFVKIAELMI